VKPIVIDTGIIANFSAIQDCSLGLNITNNSLYTDSLRIFWGDGTYVTNATFHLYNSIGSYNITFIAYGRNCSDTLTSTILIDTLPKSTILYQLSNCHDTIVLNSQYTSNSYLWDFGDGQSSTQSSINHAYAQPGNYTIQLINSNNNCKDSITQSIYVSSTPNADFNFSLSCQGEFETTIDTFPGWTYNWNLGDGTTSNAANILHNYTNDSTYLVTLVANNGYCSDSISKAITFKKYTNYSLEWVLDTCAGKLFLSFNPQLSDSIYIDFGDGNVTTNLPSFHQYLYPNINQVQAIIHPGTNCADTINNSIDLLNSEFNFQQYIPNSFSPNNDGLNDFFVIPNNTCIDFEIEVYSRWGALIFYSKKPGDKWDGKFNNIDLPSGVYVLKLKTKYKDTYSTINIVR
jgi:gliding motility-associated-like protein